MKFTSSAPRKKASASSKQEWVPQPHQQKALNLLTSVANGGLFLDPGMGKTSIILEAFRRFKEQGQVDKLIVFAPLRVASVAWPGELSKWSNFQDLTSTLVWGSKKDRRLEDDVDIYLINHEFLNTRSVANLPPLLEKHRCMLVVDESTAFKNPSSKRFKTLKLLLPCFVRRYILTGTPIPNGVEGLWSQCYIVDEGGLLGPKLMKFRNTFMRPVFRPGVPITLWEAAPGAVEKISEIVSPVVLQLKGEDYLKLPDYIFNEIAVDIPREQYDLLERELLMHLQSQTVASPNVASNIIRLRQVANGAVYTNTTFSEYEEIHTAKLDALEELLMELEGKPCLLLYQFAHDLDRIRRRIGIIPTLSNTTPATARRMCDQFVAGELPVLAGHPASMGHGLNLQGGGAHHMIWFGLDYNLEYWQQTLQRLRRQGNTAPSVTIHTIVANRTVEQTIARTLQDKDSNQQLFLTSLRDTLSIH